MRIGILTASRTDNNGTDLQALAMQNLFQKLGCPNVELINYVCENIDCEHIQKLSIRNIIFWPLRYYIHRNHMSFRKCFFCKSSLIFYKSNLHQVEYDVIVVGSDQIWNLDLTGGDMSFYLPFSTKAKKYSYAASLGSAKIEKWNRKYNIKSLLQAFDGISLRETSGVDSLFKIGISSRHDLDPILMGDPEDWKGFTTPAIKKNYILLYLVEPSQLAIDYARKISKEKGWKIFMCNPPVKPVKGVTRLFFVGVGKWLNLLANANMVITNSYHGLSFSILFQREFRLCKLQDEMNNNRMRDLLEELSLTDRVLDREDKIYKPINWNDINNTLSSLKKDSNYYIKSILNNK